jgi:type IV pilus assembly protein PilC
MHVGSLILILQDEVMDLPTVNEDKLAEHSNIRGRSERLSDGDLSLFCYQLSLIFKSGIPFLEGMNLFAEEMADSRFKSLARKLYQDVFVGTSFHTSLENLKVFPPYMVNMLAMAEATGTLDSELERLSIYYDKSEKLKRRITNALTYPVILAVLMGGIILLLIVRILPIFHEILVSLGGEIPPVTQALLNFSTGIRSNSLILLVLAVLIVILIILFSKTAPGKRIWDKCKITTPLIRSIGLKTLSARFSMGMSMLLKSGIPFDDAMGMVHNIIENSYAAEKLEACREEIRAGTDVSAAFSKMGLFPALFVKMLQTGYRTGEMEKAMEKISDIYENEADRYMSRITSAIEPILVIILSLVVGVILLAIMLPLISIMSSIG